MDKTVKVRGSDEILELVQVDSKTFAFHIAGEPYLFNIGSRNLSSILPETSEHPYRAEIKVFKNTGKEFLNRVEKVISSLVKAGSTQDDLINGNVVVKGTVLGIIEDIVPFFGETVSGIFNGFSLLVEVLLVYTVGAVYEQGDIIVVEGFWDVEDMSVYIPGHYGSSSTDTWAADTDLAVDYSSNAYVLAWISEAVD